MDMIDRGEVYERLAAGGAEALEKAVGEVGAAARTPAVIGEEIRSLSEAATATTLWFAVEIGRRLTEAKGLIGHGGWLGFLRTETRYSASTAQNLMRVYREYGAQQGNLFGAELEKSQAFGRLSFTKALALLALPEAEREDFVEVHDVESMSTRELQAAIRERDEARKALEAEREAGEGAAIRLSELESQLEEMRRGNVVALKQAKDRAEALDEARAALEEAQAAVDLARGDAEKLRAQIKELESRPVDVAVMAVDQEALDKAKAEAAAEMQAKLDRAQEKAAKAEEKRKAAESALAAAKEQLEAARRSEAQAVIASDRELATFELLFQQAQEKVNVMHGLLIKVRGRGDETLTGKLQQALLALSEAIRGVAV